MQTQSIRQTVYNHAIVIGGSIAGLTTARVLTDHFERVTVIERDRPTAATEFRKGAPQNASPPRFAGAWSANFGTTVSRLGGRTSRGWRRADEHGP